MGGSPSADWVKASIRLANARLAREDERLARANADAGIVTCEGCGFEAPEHATCCRTQGHWHPCQWCGTLVRLGIANRTAGGGVTIVNCSWAGTRATCDVTSAVCGECEAALGEFTPHQRMLIGHLVERIEALER